MDSPRSQAPRDSDSKPPPLAAIDATGDFALEQTNGGDKGLPASESVAFLAPPQAPDELGRLGGYRVLRLLGQGGMGMVFHAEDVRLQRPVALKVMKPEVAGDPTSRERFLREAQAAARLRHDHIVTVYQVGEERGVLFLAMEFLDGASLDSWLRSGRRPTLTQVLRLGKEIARGLAAAHAKGLIHRDIKPANIWLDAAHQGRVKILDFGLAHTQQEDVHLTRSGTVIGTPAFMAPEQARGEEADPRADLFSLGCVLYVLATGELPFTGRNATAVLSAVLTKDPKPTRALNPAISEELDKLIERLLWKEPAGRPATAQEVVTALQAMERATASAGTAPAAILSSESSLPTGNFVPVPAEGVAAATSQGASRARADAPASVDKSGRRRGTLVVGGLLLAFLAMLAGVIILVADKDGKKTEVSDPGSRVDVDPQGKVKDKELSPKTPTITPEPLKLKAGEPISAMALVRTPKALPGLRSWSIETVPNRQSASLAYRPDGQMLATGGLDGSVRLWKPGMDRPERVLLAHGFYQVHVAWSPDGKYIASGGRDALLCFWEAASGRLLRTVPTQYPVISVAWSPNGRTVATGGEGGKLQLWDVATGRPGQVIPHPNADDFCISLTWSSDGKLLASGWWFGQVAVWDVAGARSLHEWTMKDAGVLNAVFSPDCRRLAACSGGNIQVWEIESGKLTATLAHGTRVSALGWSSDGRSLISSDLYSQTTHVWDPNSGKILRSLPVAAAGNCIYSPDGKTLATTDGPGNLAFRELETGKTVGHVPCTDTCHSVAWSPTGAQLALAGLVAGTTLWQTDGWRFLRRLDNRGTLNQVVAWSPDGKTLATGYDELPQVELWNTETGAKIGTLLGHAAGIKAAAWSRDGKRLATAGIDKTVRVWDAVGKPLHTLNGHTDPVRALAWSPDGQTLASGGDDQTIRIWDLATGKPRHILKSPVFALAWSPNGKTLASWGGPVVYWDPVEGRKQLTAPAGNGYSVNWSPDGKILAVGQPGIILCNGETAEPLRRLQALPDIVGQLTWSPDGKTIIAATEGSVQILDVASGKLRGFIIQFQDEGYVIIQPDGHWRGSPGVEKKLIYIALSEDGRQDMYTPEEFAQKFGWKNDPEKVRLAGE